MTDLAGTGRWMFDAWSPRDGLAFASKREKKTRLRTVFVRPPAWHPVVVGPAIAFSAGRGVFQRGFFVQNREVAFDSLEELIQVVRQAYILGGAPPPGGEQPGETGGSPHPQPPMDPQWSSARSRLLDDNDPGELLDVTAGDVGRHFEQWMRWLADASLRALAAAIRPGGGAATPQDLSDWMVVLYRMGIWDDPHDMLQSIDQNLRSYSHLLFHFGPQYWWSMGLRGGSASGPILGGLLFRVPFASRMSLGDWIARMLGDRAEFVHLDQSNFARLLFGACAIVAAAGQPGFDLLHPDASRRALRRAGAAWIAAQQPRTDPHSEAGTALTDFAGSKP